ncbi:MAG: hypothetical protein PVG61_08300 [Dehalococcoidia bacterium]
MMIRRFNLLLVGILIISAMVIFPNSCTQETLTTSPITSETATHVASHTYSLSGWQQLQTQYNDLLDIWGSSSSDVFTVGYSGTILHYDGKTWKQMNSGTNVDLVGVWGSSSTDVYAVGDEGVILHYDGNTWSRMDIGITDDLMSVWGASPSDIFITFWGPGSILHFNGEKWETMQTPLDLPLHKVWGTSSTDIFTVGRYYSVIHYDGQTWDIMTKDSDSFGALVAIWGSSSTDIYAGGSQGELKHYDGEKWRQIPNYEFDYIFDIWGNSPNNVFVLDGAEVLHYDGKKWNKLDISVNGEDLYGIWGSSDTEIFIVGEDGIILHYSGE